MQVFLESEALPRRAGSRLLEGALERRPPATPARQVAPLATVKPAALRRGEIIDAATVEFAETGLAGTSLEVIAARAGISHPRVVQMFGSKRALFLAVVEATFDRIDETFAEAARVGSRSELVALGDAYRRLLPPRPLGRVGDAPRATRPRQTRSCARW